MSLLKWFLAHRIHIVVASCDPEESECVYFCVAIVGCRRRALFMSPRDCDIQSDVQILYALLLH